MDFKKLRKLNIISNKYVDRISSLDTLTQAMMMAEPDGLRDVVKRSKKICLEGGKEMFETFNDSYKFLKGLVINNCINLSEETLQNLNPQDNMLNNWYDLLSSGNTSKIKNAIKSGLLNDHIQDYRKSIDELRDEYEHLRFMKEKKESLRDKLKDNFPNLEEQHLDYIIAKDTLYEMKGGFSSGVVLSSLTNVAKQDTKEATKYMKDVYYGLDLGEYEKFRPALKDVVELDNSSLLIMENTFSKIPAYILTKSIIDPDNKLNINSADFYIKHNLYLMGLLHKEGVNAVNRSFTPGKDVNIKNNVYQTLDKIPHYKAIDIPLEDISNKSFREFKQDTPKDLSVRIKPIINDVLDYLKDGQQCIIDGDWKGNGMNLPNGYKIDPLFCYGKEIVDIANFLSEPELKLTNDQVRNYLNQYISIRSQHDKKFAYNTKKHNEMKTWFDSVRLKELSVYLSCMRKRPLDKLLYHRRRIQFINNTKELLNAGNF